MPKTKADWIFIGATLAFMLGVVFWLTRPPAPGEFCSIETQTVTVAQGDTVDGLIGRWVNRPPQDIRKARDIVTQLNGLADADQLKPGVLVLPLSCKQ